MMGRTPDDVEQRIAALLRQSDAQLAQEIRRNLLRPDPVTTAAMRSRALADRTHAVIEDLLRRVALVTQRRGTSRDVGLRAALVREHRLLRLVIAGHRAADGVEDEAHAANVLAARELQRRHAAEFVRLVNQAQLALRKRSAAAEEGGGR